MPWAVRSQRSRLPGRPGDPPSGSEGMRPRAGLALTISRTWAPSSAAMVGTIECQASSQTMTAPRPHRVSKAATDSPGSTKRSSSKTP